MDLNATKLSHKKWKALLKKEKRKLKRQTLAKGLENEAIENAESNDESDCLTDEEQKRQRHMQWLEREKEAQNIFKAKKDKEEREKIQKENDERLIREQFEREKQKLLGIENDPVSAEVPEKLLLEESPSNCRDNKTSPKVWHNPEPPNGFDCEKDVPNVCTFFQKVGACRFGMSCSRAHPLPTSSSTIMFPAMFFCFGMEHAIHDVLDSDVNLEYDDQDTYEEFHKFYDETYPEFQKAGTIRNYYVCCNYEPHLKGNVYVEYFSKSEAKKAFQMFNGRWFDKRQLSCQFVKIKSWTSAICGSFHKNKCPKGKHCNFLHVFQCPKKLESADQTHQKSVFSRLKRSPHISHASYCRDGTKEGSRSRSSHSSSLRRYSYRSRSRSRPSKSSLRSSHRPRSRSRLSKSSLRSSHRSRSRSRSNKSSSWRSSHRSRSRSRSGSRLFHRSNHLETRSSALGSPEQRRSASTAQISDDLAELKKTRKNKKRKKSRKEKKESDSNCKALNAMSSSREDSLLETRTPFKNSKKGSLS